MGRLASQNTGRHIFSSGIPCDLGRVGAPRARAPGSGRLGWPLLLGLVWTYGPALAVVAVTAAFTGRHGSQRLGSAIVRWRVGWRWYARYARAVRCRHPPCCCIQCLSVRQSPRPFSSRLTCWAIPCCPAPCADRRCRGRDWLARFCVPGLLEWLTPSMASVFWAWCGQSGTYRCSRTMGHRWEGLSFLLLLLQLAPTSILFTWVFNHTRGAP